MNRPVPKSNLLGLSAAIAATALWITEQTTGAAMLEILTIPAKLALLVAFPLFLPHLSSLVHGRRGAALSLALTAIVVTAAAAAAYLPWRDRFCEQFSNDVYKWYYTTSSSSHLSYPDFDAWLVGWRAYRPHLTEFGILVGFYAIVVGGCFFFRLDRLGGFLLASIAYAYLLFIPMVTGLIEWSSDTFLHGIVFDSISFDMFPPIIWFAGDYSIFLYVFMLIFFSAAAFHSLLYTPQPFGVMGE